VVRDKYIEGVKWKTHIALWGYKYIHARWVRIVCEVGIHPTPPFGHIHARMDIGDRGYLYDTAYGVPPPTPLYNII
jgi:hypothetical protein